MAFITVKINKKIYKIACAEDEKTYLTALTKKLENYHIKIKI